MNKLIIAVMIGILVIVVTTAGVITITLSDAVFNPKPAPSTSLQQGVINFKCDGRAMSLTLSEPNLDIDDDFEEAVKYKCQGTVSEVIDWTGRTYKQNEYGTRSFDTVKVNKDTCAKLDMEYNSKDSKCIDRPIQVTTSGTTDTPNPIIKDGDGF